MTICPLCHTEFELNQLRTNVVDEEIYGRSKVDPDVEL